MSTPRRHARLDQQNMPTQSRRHGTGLPTAMNRVWRPHPVVTESVRQNSLDVIRALRSTRRIASVPLLDPPAGPLSSAKGCTSSCGPPGQRRCGPAGAKEKGTFYFSPSGQGKVECPLFWWRRSCSTAHDRTETSSGHLSSLTAALGRTCACAASARCGWAANRFLAQARRSLSKPGLRSSICISPRRWCSDRVTLSRCPAATSTNPVVPQAGLAQSVRLRGSCAGLPSHQALLIYRQDPISGRAHL